MGFMLAIDLSMLKFYSPVFLFLHYLIFIEVFGIIFYLL
jgi:hypothetical protein